MMFMHVLLRTASWLSQLFWWLTLILPVLPSRNRCCSPPAVTSDLVSCREKLVASCCFVAGFCSFLVVVHLLTCDFIHSVLFWSICLDKMG